MGFNGDQPFVDFCQAVRIVRGLAFQHQCRTFGVGSQHCFERSGIAAWRFLRERHGRVQVNFGSAGMKWLALSVAKLEAA